MKSLLRHLCKCELLCKITKGKSSRVMAKMFICFLFLGIYASIHADAYIYYNSTAQDILSSVDESKCDFNKTYDLDMSEVVVTFADPETDLNITSKVYEFNITELELNCSKRLVVYVHGFSSDSFEETYAWAAEALRNLPGIYLLMIDYTYYTKELQGDEFVLAVLRSYYVGKALSDVLIQIKDKGIPSENMHCVGFSLGAQVVGYAAEVYYESTDEKIDRISGIEPAGLCFADGPDTEHVRSGLAGYVDLYHCTGPRLASDKNLGDIDFYFNSVESPQPGCENGSYFPLKGYVEDPAACGHLDCIVYWLNTVCSPYLYPAFGQNGTYEEDEVTFAGYYRIGNFSGVLYVSTSD